MSRQYRVMRRALTAVVATVTALSLAGLTVSAQAAPPTGPSPQAGTIGFDDPSEEDLQMTAVGDTLFFVADDKIHGRELWKSDGTATGTTLVKDINPGEGDSELSWSTAVGGELFFFAYDGDGYGLWKSDGTPAGTELIKEVVPGDPWSYGYSDLTAVVGGTLFFAAADDDHGFELWKSDGTTAGTVVVKDINPGEDDSRPNGLTAVGGTLFFLADDGDDYGLWKSDGTAAGTTTVEGNDAGDAEWLTAVGATLYFTVDDNLTGHELWKSDGTSSGTVVVKKFDPETRSLSGLTAVGQTLFFVADDGVHGEELWKSDGTASGTAMIKDINLIYNDSYGPYGLTAMGETLYFNADDGIRRNQLWQSDGTATGTTMVKEPQPGDDTGDPEDLTVVGGTLFFTAYDDDYGWELWKSDGTAAGTWMVKDIRPGTGNFNYPNSSYPDWLTPVGGTLFFTATDGTHGYELWKSDGTTAGTVPVTRSVTPTGPGSPGGPTPPGGSATPPSNVFTAPAKGKANTKKATLTVPITVPGAGTVTVAPVGKALVKRTTVSVRAGTVQVVIKPSKVGKKKLKKAKKSGKKAKLKVKVDLTYTPVGGTASTQTKTYTLKLR